MDFGQMQCLKLKCLNDGFVYYNHTACELRTLLGDYCDVFISHLNSPNLFR